MKPEQLIKSDLNNKYSDLLNQKPKDAAIKTDKYSNNAQYLEIGYLQFELDRTFGALNWSWVIDSQSVMINSVQCTGTLTIFVDERIIKRSGTGCKEIQLKRGANAATPENMSGKALERDVPIANAQAFKNACKTLGNKFGRHLNRGFQFDFVPNEDATQLRNESIRESLS